MFCLGDDFDVDERYPWARGILGNRALPSTERLNHLVATAAQKSP